MTKRKSTFRGYLKLLRRDVARSWRKLVVIKRYKAGQVVITMTRPRFAASRNYFRKWRAGWGAGRDAESLRAVFTSVGLLVAGVIGIGFALIQLSSVQATPVTQVQKLETDATPVVKAPPSLARSEPTQIRIPDIDVDASLIQLGQNDDGTLETPEGYDVAGWYTGSPTPGEVGPSVIVGHVDNYQGAAVFFRLKELQPGQKISISRVDGSVAEFAVTQVAQFDQNNFPTTAVYGNIDHAGLRLITCGGPFDHVNQRYTQNTVVYATYSAPHGG